MNEGISFPIELKSSPHYVIILLTVTVGEVVDTNYNSSSLVCEKSKSVEGRDGRLVMSVMLLYDATQHIHSNTHTHTYYAEICSAVLYSTVLYCTELYDRDRGTYVPERNIGTDSMDGVALKVELRLQSTSPLKSSAPSSNMPL